MPAPGGGKAWSLMRGSAAVAIFLRSPRPGEDAPFLRAVSPIIVIDKTNEAPLFRRLLELNASGLGSVAFGVHDDRVVAVSERPTRDLDPSEVRYILQVVGAVADHYDDELTRLFGGTKVSDRRPIRPRVNSLHSGSAVSNRRSPARPRCPTIAAAFVVVTLGAPRVARAIEYDIHAESVSQAYQIRGPWGGPCSRDGSRRRCRSRSRTASPSVVRGSRCACGSGSTESLATRVGARRRGASKRRRARDGRISFRDSSDEPWIRRFAYFDASGLLRGALDVRVGRILEHRCARVLRVRCARAGVPRLVRDRRSVRRPRSSRGICLVERALRARRRRSDRGAWEAGLAPFVSDRAYAPVVALAIEAAPWQAAFARAVYRRVWTRDGVAEDRIGAAVDARLHPRVRLTAARRSPLRTARFRCSARRFATTIRPAPSASKRASSA